MGSATRSALESARAALDATKGVDLAAGRQLLAAGRTMGASSQLLGALSNPSGSPEGTAALVDEVFAELDRPARTLLQSMVASRWSSGGDLLAGIEEVGIRAIASTVEGESLLEAELFEFGRAVTSEPELELALGSKRGTAEAKLALVTELLGARASAHSLEIASHLVRQPRGRRIGELIRSAVAIAADTAGKGIATVSSARPMTIAQRDAVAASVAARYGREHVINEIIDPSLIGGVRVQVGNEVIDGSIASRLADMKLQLAG